MKKSEELSLKAAEEENDLKALGIYTKALRERRNESFEEKWLDKISKSDNVAHIKYNESQGKCSIFIKSHGYVDFFPKKNTLLIRKDNKWKKPGLKWLIKILDL